MPEVQEFTLVELPQKLHRTLFAKCKVNGRGTDISESVVHTAMMGLLLMTSKVTLGMPPAETLCSSGFSCGILGAL